MVTEPSPLSAPIEHGSKTRMQHQHRVRLVTGAAIAAAYARDGAAVGLVDFDAPAAAALAQRLTSAGHSVHFAAANVGRYADCDAAWRSVEAALGPIDTLVNNAGISPKQGGQPAPVWQMAPAEWLRVVDVNLNSAFNLVRLLAPGAVERRFGRIVAMSSVAGKATLDIAAAHYATIKAALIGMPRHLAGELGPHGITVNALAPGRIDTPMVAGAPGCGQRGGRRRDAAAPSRPARRGRASLSVPQLKAGRLHHRAGDRRGRRLVDDLMT